MQRARTVLASLLLVAIVATPAADGGVADDQKAHPRLEDVLAAVGAYVRQYEASFSAVVSHEHYVQRARGEAGPQARQLRSDVALIAVGGANWLFYRDVYEVDGKAIRDRADRLAELFKAPRPDSASQARIVLEEGARYNLGPITRTLNTPTQALAFLRPENQSRSMFTLHGRSNVDGVETYELRFRETASPRMIVTRDNAAASGSIWVAVDSGAIIRSELRISSVGAAALLRVTYTRQPRLALWVPAKMVEQYEQEPSEPTDIGPFDSIIGRATLFIEGTATYTDFRQFAVDTKLIIRPPQ
jgi:hypothetical protein